MLGEGSGVRRCSKETPEPRGEGFKTEDDTVDRRRECEVFGADD